MKLEELVPYRVPPGLAKDVSRVRGTLLWSSLQALRKRGLEESYFRTLAEPHHETMRQCIAGEWLPIEVALAHYEACEALALSAGDRAEMGRDVSMQTMGSFIGTLAKLATGAGVTVWNGLVHFPRAWDRVMDGGASRVLKIGPKEARIELVGVPLMRIPYFRVALRAYIVAGCELFATRVYGNDVAGMCGPKSAGYRIAWA